MRSRLRPSPYGIRIGQTWQQVGLYFEIINLFDVRLFIELGMMEGGLASILLPRAEYETDFGFEYIGVEQNIDGVNDQVRRRISDCYTADLYHGDVFQEDTIEYVENCINDTFARTLLLCDNGDKPRELETYAPLLRVNDLVTVHDYGTEITDLSVLKDFEEVDPQYFRIAGNLPLFRKIK